MLALQVHTLLKGLEKIAASADIPMLVAGDFNSVPGSAAHQLLVKQAVDERHPVSTTAAWLRHKAGGLLLGWEPPLLQASSRHFVQGSLPMANCPKPEGC